MGIVYGAELFAPLMLSHGEGGHILNTVSMAGFRGLPGAGAYSATKAAALSVTEALAQELAGSGIGVTALCPGFMKTPLHANSLARPDDFGGSKNALGDPEVVDSGLFARLITAGHEPMAVARRAIAGIKADELYVVTHPEHRDDVAGRGERILQAYHRTAMTRHAYD